MHKDLFLLHIFSVEFLCSFCEKLLRTLAFCELSFLTNKSSNIRWWRCTQGKIFGWKHLYLNSSYRSGKLIWHKDIFMCFLKYVSVKLFCRWKKNRYGWGILKWIFLGRFDSCCESLLRFIKLLWYQILGIMCRDSQDPGERDMVLLIQRQKRGIFG